MIDSFVLTSQGWNVFVIINDQAFISISKQIPRANTYTSLPTSCGFPTLMDDENISQVTKRRVNTQ